MSQFAITRNELIQRLREPEPLLTMVIKGHHLVEGELNVLLGEYLPASTKLDVKRLTFLLKVDMLIGLGALLPEYRPVFAVANKIRNDFAHDPRAGFDETQALDALNVLRSAVGESLDFESPTRTLETVFDFLYFMSALGTEEAVKRKLHHEVWRELAAEFVERTKHYSVGSPKSARTEVSRKLRQGVERKLAERSPST